MAQRHVPDPADEAGKAAPPAADRVTEESSGFDLVREIFRLAPVRTANRPPTRGPSRASGVGGRGRP
ncbi:hypothetical protein P3T37_003657 [Kitasatospora sp. MAA4]|nr:hypothetical protein [Kitasatospora sp. MAA4]